MTRVPAVWRRGIGRTRPDEGTVFSATSVGSEEGQEYSIAMIDTAGGRLLVQVVGGQPEIGERLVPVMRILSKGPPIEYCYKWARRDGVG